MPVVAFPNLSPQGPGAAVSWELRSLTARHLSPLSGVVTTLERPGAHWAARLPFANLASDRRARLQTFAASCRGHANRFYLPVFGWTRRGSFSAPELLTNNQFASGTTGWESSVANELALSASDGVLRATRAANTADSLVRRSAAAAVTQYAPHAARVLTLTGRGSFVAGDGRLAIDGVAIGSVTSAHGMTTAAFVPLGATAQMGFADVRTGKVAGDYFSAAYASLARCALVDNAPNALLQSDELDATWTTTRATVDDQALVGPDGASTADHIAEDGTAANTHFISQAVTVSSAVAEYSFSCSLKAVNRTWARLRLTESTSSHELVAHVNLSTGALGTVSVSGANWTNARAFVVAEGNGWYRLHVVGRKASAGTTITAAIVIAEADNDITFSGLSQNSIGAWRASLAASSVPVRGALTTTTATSGASQTGSALYLKGLPASTSGLLLQGDPVEIIIGTTSQLVRARAPLNSDAAGLGYLEFEPPLRVSPADNAAVILCNPLCKMMLDSNEAGWSDRLGGFSDLELAFVEDTYPS